MGKGSGLIRCLVTGGAGFIGSHLVGGALQRGHQVVVLDNLSTGRRENLARYENDLEFVRGDIRDRDLVFGLARGADLVFHQAALSTVPESVAQPGLSAQVNDLGTLNVFEAARAAGARRVIYASSAAVYGHTPQLPHAETLTPRPHNPYAAHKLLGEHYGAVFSQLYGLEVVSLRYFNVYGPGQNPASPYSGVISIFLDRLLRGQSPQVFGDGEQSRDFVFVQDAVEASFLAAEAPGAAGRVFNVGTGRGVRLKEVLDLLSELIPARVRPTFGPPRPGDVRASRAETALAREVLGFEAQVSFEDGLARTLAWFREL